MFDELGEDYDVVVKFDFEGIVGYFCSEKYFSVYFVDVVDLQVFVVVLAEGGGVKREVDFLIIVNSLLIFYLYVLYISTDVNEFHKVL